MNRIVLFGAGAFAEIAHYYFTHDSNFRVAGFVVDAKYLVERTFKGLPVVALDEAEEAFPASDFGMFVALGIRGVNRVRAEKMTEVTSRGYRLVSFLSSKADVGADLELRPNTMIMERAGIQPFVQIGKGVIVWSASRVGFRSRIDDHCWVTSPILGESVVLGERTFVGLNATIAPFVSVGKSNVIGAGALILHHTKDDEVYPGGASVPSRVPSHRLKNFR